MKNTAAIAVTSGRFSTGIKTYDSLISRYQGPLTFTGIRAFMDRAAEEGKSASTIRLLKCAFKKAAMVHLSDMRERAAVSEAFKAIKTEKPCVGLIVDTLPTSEEIARLINGSSPRVSAIVDFLVRTGLRVSELTGIVLSEVMVKKGMAYLLIHGKGKKQRRVLIPVADQNGHLGFDSIKSLFNGKRFLFENERGGRIDRKYLHRVLKAAGDSVGIKGFHPHVCRHYFATLNIVEKKVSVASVARYLGHASSTTCNDFYVRAEMTAADLGFVA